MTGSAITLEAMSAKPRTLLGLIVGAVAAWLAVTAVAYAGRELTLLRTNFKDGPANSWPWVLVILVAALLVGLLLSSWRIAGGAMVGAGLLMTVAGLGVQVLPMRQAVQLSRLFDVGKSSYNGYVLWDGTVLLIGVMLLVMGFRRLAADARYVPLPLPPVQQDAPTYYNPYNNPPR